MTNLDQTFPFISQDTKLKSKFATKSRTSRQIQPTFKCKTLDTKMMGPQEDDA